MEKRSGELLSSLSLEISPRVTVATLSVPQQQMVEVAKALSMESKILIFDEPTATLAEKETEALFRIIRVLKEQADRDHLYLPSPRRDPQDRGPGNGPPGWPLHRDDGDRGGRHQRSHPDDGGPRHQRSVPQTLPGTAVRWPSNCGEFRDRGVLHDINLKIHRGEIVGSQGWWGRAERSSPGSSSASILPTPERFDSSEKRRPSILP